jgi:putative endonuclease
MDHFVYIILSKKNSKIKTYVGYTNNLKKRLFKHNSGNGAKSTKGRKWKFIYKEKYETKSEALSREYFIKKNRTLRKKIINLHLGN